MAATWASQRPRSIAGIMFEEFDSKTSREGRGRRGVSALLSLGIFAALALVVGGAVTAHQVRKHRMEQEQEIEFANLHQVRAPKPKALVKPAARNKSQVARQKVAALKSIPSERPNEAEGELADADDTGAVDGIVEKNGNAVGSGSAGSPPPPPPPAPKPEPVVRPRSKSGRRSLLLDFCLAAALPRSPMPCSPMPRPSGST